ncbi:MAG: tetratricopeptide repeat protein [Terriglobia bacterium]
MQTRQGTGALPASPAVLSGTLGRKAGWRRGLARIIESPLFPAALVIAAVFILYARALSGGFVYDDEYQVVENVFVTNAHLWRHIFSGSVWSFGGIGNAAKFYRPLMIFCFWVIYRLAGPQPFYFHLFQVILFAATAVMLYVTAKHLVGSKVAALIASLLWVMHPQKVEAAAWVSAMCDTGCGLFYLTAFYLFLRAEQPGHRQGGAEDGFRLHGSRRWLLGALSVIALFVALLFKEMALSFPLILAAYWFFHPAKGDWVRRAIRLAPYVAIVAAYLGIRRLALGHLTSGGHLFPITGKLLADAVALLGAHTHTFLWPAHLSVYRGFHAERVLASPWPWIMLLALLVVLVFRKRQPDLAFFVFWWPVTLLPCLDIRQLSNPVVADRMTYLPSAGLCLACGCLLASLCAGQGFSTRWRKIAVISGLAVVMTLESIASARAIPRWNNNQAIVKYSLKQDPESGYLHLIRAWNLRFRKNDLVGATQEFETALRLNKASPTPQARVEYQALVGLGAIAQEEGNTDAAIAKYRQAIRVTPNLRDAYLSLGAIYMPRGDYAQAAAYFQKAVESDGYDTSAKFLLGSCWMKMGKYPQAAQVFEAARQVDPDYWPAYQAEARALDAAGERQKAAGVLALLGQRKRQ